MSRENLLEIIQKLPQGNVEFVVNHDPILQHLNEVTAQNRGIGRQKSTIQRYQNYVVQLSTALLELRKHQINKTKADQIVDSAMLSLKDNITDDFCFGARYQSGSALQRTLLAHQLGFISEDHLDWEKVITDQNTDILNVFISQIQGLQHYGLELEPPALNASAETFALKFEQLIDLQHKINSYIVFSGSPLSDELMKIELQLSLAIKSVYQSWVEQIIRKPCFYELLLMSHALSRQLDEANKDDEKIKKEFALASTFAEEHGYEYDYSLGLFKSPQPKRAT